MCYYRPYPPQAYQDMKDLQFAVFMGPFLRNMHRWAAHGMVVRVFLHMCRVFYTGSYKKPRQFNWVVGVLLLLLKLGLSFTGYLLPWDQLESNARKALVAFLASATPEDARQMLARKGHPLTPEDAAIEAGRQDFARFGCAGCHGTELQGGLANPNAQGEQVPSLLHVSDDYTKDEVVGIIRDGRMPPLDNVKGPSPPLYMPSWKHVLSDEDINRIADFLWSKQQKKKEIW